MNIEQQIKFLSLLGDVKDIEIVSTTDKSNDVSKLNYLYINKGLVSGYLKYLKEEIDTYEVYDPIVFSVGKHNVDNFLIKFDIRDVLKGSINEDGCVVIKGKSFWNERKNTMTLKFVDKKRKQLKVSV